MKRVTFAVLFVLAGCAGKPQTIISEDQVSRLMLGRTLLAEVESAWGAPSERHAGIDGPQLIYSWDAGRANVASVAAVAGIAAGTIETQRREVVLTFSSDTTLKDIERRTRTTRQGYISGPPPQ